MAGEVVHVEFPSTDIDRAQRFWSGVFGWSFGDPSCPGWTTGWRRSTTTPASR